MAIGSGWQAIVAYVNLATYYVIGLPIGCVLGFKTSLGVDVSSFSLSLSLSLSLIITVKLYQGPFIIKAQVQYLILKLSKLLILH